MNLMNRKERRAHKARHGWEPLRPATIIQKTPQQRQELFDHLRASFPDHPAAEIWERIREAHDELKEVWINDTYQVHVIFHAGRGPGGCDIVQLSIRRLDRAHPRDWRDFQRIKDQLVGPECEGVELYPANSRLVDTANQWHVWCVADPTYRWPVGYTERAVTSDSGGGAVQRPMDE